MPHIPAWKREDLPELGDYLQRSDDRLEFVTNVQLTMAQRPPNFKSLIQKFLHNIKFLPADE